MAVEETVKEIFKTVLDVNPDEIQPDAKLVESLEVDSTEMVEISVGIKKALNIELADSELKKSHSFNDIIDILKSKGLS